MNLELLYMIKEKHNYYLTEEAKIKLNMSVALENINSKLYREDSKSIDLRIIDTIRRNSEFSKSIL